ncbi:MAG: hypothetical protein JWO36_815 [Myxococcales bacterium]|nr:hypothetical protein [Myxococcales bacterium]
MWVNGRPVGAPVAVGISDRIQIGAYQLAIERAVERLPRIVGVDPVEIALIEAIEKGDHSSRLVYADWLEAHGQTTRAEFLRLQETLLVMEPEDAAFAAGIARLRELSVSIDAGWRGQLARLPT